ncbi:hypothetical protein QOZ80_9AG0677360 [Eleusine coracana subsp. coracana]|nr:hypothetical protein QOZ80_9AG0677360 [Eleusine coracana subsp. coracana]
MEQTVNSLAYKGSISDAINQSRQQKKLFVVYISGEDEASSSLEQSTLVDEHVAEVIGRCCIFLHLKQGNVDAAQFSAIYPQKSVPSISVIGLNGVMLWHHEGHIIAENLKESIEKAWAALHLQETAATLLTASLASRNAESMNTTSTALPHLQGSSTSENTSASSSQPVNISGASGVAHPTDLVSQLPSRTTHDEPLGKNGKEGSESVSDPVDRTVEKLDSACTEVKTDVPDSLRSSNKGSSSDPKQFLKRKNKVDGGCTEAPSEASSRTITDDIHLSIRMPSGDRLEIKLTKQDVLREVKNFVDENLGSGVGSYDLSLIYPKRVFTEQDMEATLCELGIQNRHAMMVVPHRPLAQVPRPQSSARSYDAGGNSGGGGYFGYLRTVLSYANPLSYFRGSPISNPEVQANEDLQQNRTGSDQWSHPAQCSRMKPSSKQSGPDYPEPRPITHFSPSTRRKRIQRMQSSSSPSCFALFSPSPSIAFCCRASRGAVFSPSRVALRPCSWRDPASNAAAAIRRDTTAAVTAAGDVGPAIALGALCVPQPYYTVVP